MLRDIPSEMIEVEEGEEWHQIWKFPLDWTSGLRKLLTKSFVGESRERHHLSRSPCFQDMGKLMLTDLISERTTAAADTKTFCKPVKFTIQSLRDTVNKNEEDKNQRKKVREQDLRNGIGGSRGNFGRDALANMREDGTGGSFALEDGHMDDGSSSAFGTEQLDVTSADGSARASGDIVHSTADSTFIVGRGGASEKTSQMFVSPGSVVGRGSTAQSLRSAIKGGGCSASPRASPRSDVDSMGCTWLG